MKAAAALASLTVIALGTPAIALAGTVASDPVSFSQNIYAERIVAHPNATGSRVPVPAVTGAPGRVRVMLSPCG